MMELRLLIILKQVERRRKKNRIKNNVQNEEASFYKKKTLFFVSFLFISINVIIYDQVFHISYFTSFIFFLSCLIMNDLLKTRMDLVGTVLKAARNAQKESREKKSASVVIQLLKHLSSLGNAIYNEERKRETKIHIYTQTLEERETERDGKRVRKRKKWKESQIL